MGCAISCVLLYVDSYKTSVRITARVSHSVVTNGSLQTVTVKLAVATGPKVLECAGQGVACCAPEVRCAVLRIGARPRSDAIARAVIT